MSSLPRDSNSFGVIHLVADKGLHVTLFAVLGILLFQAITNPRRKIVQILLFGLIVGCCSEYLQSFFPDRDPAIRDVFINLAGTGVGVLVSRILWGRPTALRTDRAPAYTFSRADGQ